jgi:hypothetical protein
MPNFAFLLAAVAAILIVYGRMARRNRVAMGDSPRWHWRPWCTC